MMNELLKKLPVWLHKQVFAFVDDIELPSYGNNKALGGNRKQAAPEDANVITSRRDAAKAGYFPVLDLDIPHWYAESSTPGHGHLILGTRLLTKPEYDKLLGALEAAGIIEPGFAESGRRSEFGTAVRLPWVKKVRF